MVQFECAGALKSLNLIHIWASLCTSQPKSEFQKYVMYGNLGQCTNLPILNHAIVAQNWLPSASRVLGIIPTPLSRALEPESEEKDVSLFQVLSNMHHVSSDLARP